ncbi:MAG: hypothetical protein SGI88_19605 [Candidatus Hydrogenedentes bacterium]|nr:hypothetical protein [Candidatus Hydrogenedentota bacterium]
MIPRRFAERSGFTIMEMLAYIVISGIVLNMCMIAFLRTGRIASAGSERLLHAQAAERFATDFARAVHSAQAVLPVAGSFETGAEQLILKSEEGYTGIGMANGKFAIWDIVQEGETYTVGRIRSYPVAYVSAQFQFDTASPAAARRVTLRMSPAKAPDESRVRVLIATLRAGSDT